MSDTLKVLTLNMLHKDFLREERVHRIAEEINALELDIVILQEVPFELDGQSKTLDYLADATGLFVSARNLHFTHKGYDSGSAILSRFPAVESGKTLCPDDEGNRHYDSCYTVLETEARPVIVFAIHSAWGGVNEVYRERQALFLDKHAQELEIKYADREPFTILGGDMNAQPENNCIRFLTGQASLNGTGTLWIDSWKYLNPDLPGYTVVPENALAYKTAIDVGLLRPELIPPRRIDYLMVRGWAYGRAGCPLNIELVMQDEDADGYTPSDHYGIFSTFWNPAVF